MFWACIASIRIDNFSLSCCAVDPITAMYFFAWLKCFVNLKEVLYFGEFVLCNIF